MSMSWNWRIVETPSSYRDYMVGIYGDLSRCGDLSCRKKGCTKEAECFLAYDYCTGARLNVGTNKKPYCREHAEEVLQRKTGFLLLTRGWNRLGVRDPGT